MRYRFQFVLALMRLTILISIAASITAQAQTPSRFPVDDKCSLNFKGPTAAFDVEHDRDSVGGGSLFCRLSVTATQATRAISDFKAAVAEPDKLPAHSILSFPLEVVIPHKASSAKRQKIPTLLIRTRKEWVDFARYKLNRKQRAAIESAKLSDMMIVNSRAAGPGFILGDGLVFFSTRKENQIKVWHLNSEVLSD